jgi:hypothetical protein
MTELAAAMDEQRRIGGAVDNEFARCGAVHDWPILPVALMSLLP